MRLFDPAEDDIGLDVGDSGQAQHTLHHQLGKRGEVGCDDAQQTYDSAFAQLPAEDRRSQRAGLIMAAIYRTLLDEIVRDGYRVLDHRIILTPVRKIWIAIRTWLKN